MYLAPSPKIQYNRKRFLSTYRYFWDYSGGYITDFGNHLSMPKIIKDDSETPEF